MRRIICLAILSACTGGSDPIDTETSDEVVATQFGDEGPVDCAEGEPVQLADDDAVDGFVDTPAALLAERAGRFGDGDMELVVDGTLIQAVLREGVPTEHAPTDTVCSDSLSLVTEAEVLSDALGIPPTELWISVAADGASSAWWSTIVYVEPPDPNDDEPGTETAPSSDWTIDPSLEPTDFGIEDMAVTEAALWMHWDPTDLGRIEAELVWYGVDGEGSHEQTTATWTLDR